MKHELQVTANSQLGLDFLNRFTTELPADPIEQNTRRQVKGAAFSFVSPTPTAAPQLIALSPDCAQILGFDTTQIAMLKATQGTASDGEAHTNTNTQATSSQLPAKKPHLSTNTAKTTTAHRVGDNEFISHEFISHFTRVFSGNEVTSDMAPYAMAYAGHQFGNWAGQLGDGRAIALGDIKNPHDETVWTLQLKGAGATPYSRGGDGRAVLRSSIREFLCSEAMFHLGIATTRALSLCLTGDLVMRDMFYDGNREYEPGAVVCRVSNDFLRFGSFQLPAARQEHELLETLVAYTIRHHYPHLLTNTDTSTTNSTACNLEVVAAWFGEVVQRTAQLMVDWNRVGFVHGVMNTDNLSVLGETIDYGPYGFLESYDLSFTPNTTDAHGRRYRFGAQGQVAQWNLMQLAQALAPLFAAQESSLEPLQTKLDSYVDIYSNALYDMTASRLGLFGIEQKVVKELREDLQAVMALHEIDYSIFHRLLIDTPIGQDQSEARLAAIDFAWYQDETAGKPSQDAIAAMQQWLDRWAALSRSSLEYLQANPTSAPGANSAALASSSPTAAADSATCTQGPTNSNDCASTEMGAQEIRKAKMTSLNPAYVLRNWQAQLIIDAATKGDFAPLHEACEVLRNPYTTQPEIHEQWFAKRPEWARERAGCSMLSCSS